MPVGVLTNVFFQVEKTHSVASFSFLFPPFQNLSSDGENYEVVSHSAPNMREVTFPDQALPQPEMEVAVMTSSEESEVK